MMEQEEIRVCCLCYRRIDSGNRTLQRKSIIKVNGEEIIYFSHWLCGAKDNHHKGEPNFWN
jgi:hypothetical protein